MLIIEKPTKTIEAQSYKLFTNNCHFKCSKVFTFYSYHSLGFRTRNIPYLFRFLKLQVVFRPTGTGVLLVLNYRNRVAHAQGRHSRGNASYTYFASKSTFYAPHSHQRSHNLRKFPQIYAVFVGCVIINHDERILHMHLIFSKVYCCLIPKNTSHIQGCPKKT